MDSYYFTLLTHNKKIVSSSTTDSVLPEPFSLIWITNLIHTHYINTRTTLIDYQWCCQLLYHVMLIITIISWLHHYHYFTITPLPLLHDCTITITSWLPHYHYFMITPLPLSLLSSWNNYHYHYLQIYHQQLPLQLLVNVPNYHYKNS